MSDYTLLKPQPRITATIRYRPDNDEYPARNPFWEPQPLEDTLTDILAGIVMMLFIIVAALWLMVFS